MRLETEPYEDTSFDINRLYGSWEDENSDKILTLTSSFLEFGNSKSGSSTQYPGLWTDGNTLHTNFDKLGDTLEIVEDGDVFRLVNDTVNLVQTENWPENGAGDGVVYYPTPSVTIDAWGNPALAFDLWFDNPGNAPSTTITTTVVTRTRKCLRRSGSTWGDGFIRVSDTFNRRPALWLMSDRRPVLRLNVTGYCPCHRTLHQIEK